MEKYILKSAFFKRLKGLNDVEVSFSDTLTAIMGVNGAGKTTVIHALACAFQPDEGKGENHKFPEFFVPNTHSLWNGSEFHIVIKDENKKGSKSFLPSKKYSKTADRWCPHYNERPKRCTYYIGIDSCLPEIEKESKTSRIMYSTQSLADKTSKKVIEIAGYVLNKNYLELLDNEYQNHHFSGVRLQNDLAYSSLSMGTGEQRTLKILDKVLKAEPYSLILIDEIDLLLHVSALHRLIEQLDIISKKKHLQIIFTTHSTEILSMQDKVAIRYIDVISNNDGTSKNVVYDGPNDDIIRGLTGKSTLPLKIYVEDSYSQAIVKSILKKHSVCRKAEIFRFGAAKNAFTVAAGRVLSGVDLSNTLIVLDGDVYKSDGDKLTQCKATLTGTGRTIDELRTAALSCILQYHLPDEKHPEEFAYGLLMTLDNDSEIIQIARELNAEIDSHQLIGRICEQLHDEINVVMPEIIRMISDLPEWQEYIRPIEEWIVAHIDI